MIRLRSSTLAMAGAYALARALGEERDHSVAFARYEAEHRKLVDPKVRGVSEAASLLVPATRGGIVLLNLATRLWPPGVATGWVKLKLSA